MTPLSSQYLYNITWSSLTTGQKRFLYFPAGEVVIFWITGNLINNKGNNNNNISHLLKTLTQKKYTAYTDYAVVNNRTSQ